MPRTREELERLERQNLAPYAQFSADTRGRKYPEEPPDWRTHYQRDRDRVIHSRAFRRLEYKTQVFLNGTGDHLRTRLTHTMEVAAIARNIARALKLNEDLAETIALAHDLGHSPFGHKGEMVLDKLMKDHGGFEHNRQSLRVVEELEQKYPGFAGLNLTWEVREGLAKHETSYDHPGHRTGFEAKSASLEAQVANLSDEVTYYSHDLDDGLDSGLLSGLSIHASGPPTMFAANPSRSCDTVRSGASCIWNCGLISTKTFTTIRWFTSRTSARCASWSSSLNFTSKTRPKSARSRGNASRRSVCTEPCAITSPA